MPQRSGAPRPRLLPQAFYARDAIEVARDLVGKELRRGPVRLRITEVEAYRSPDDTACHARMGRTARNDPMWGPPGRAYVYLCYGIHWMLNLVTGEDGEAAAVLIRACAPVAGLGTIRERRGGKEGPALLTGPGKVAQALGLDRSHNHHPLYRRGELEVREGPAPARILAGPRVGIDYAAPEHRDAPWRFAAGDTPWVSRPAALGPLGRSPL
ncbi:MAG: DNA-3-methyladenine glycosylase [Myxococcota bacterium]